MQGAYAWRDARLLGSQGAQATLARGAWVANYSPKGTYITLHRFLALGRLLCAAQAAGIELVCAQSAAQHVHGLRPTFLL